MTGSQQEIRADQRCAAFPTSRREVSALAYEQLANGAPWPELFTFEFGPHQDRRRNVSQFVYTEPCRPMCLFAGIFAELSVVGAVGRRQFTLAHQSAKLLAVE